MIYLPVEQVNKRNSLQIHHQTIIGKAYTFRKFAVCPAMIQFMTDMRQIRLPGAYFFQDRSALFNIEMGGMRPAAERIKDNEVQAGQQGKPLIINKLAIRNICGHAAIRLKTIAISRHAGMLHRDRNNAESSDHETSGYGIQLNARIGKSGFFRLMNIGEHAGDICQRFPGTVNGYYLLLHLVETAHVVESDHVVNVTMGVNDGIQPFYFEGKHLFAKVWRCVNNDVFACSLDIKTGATALVKGICGKAYPAIAADCGDAY